VLFCVCLTLDASSAVHEDQSTRFVSEIPDDNADLCFTHISAPMQIVNQCVVEDDLDDIAAFPVFSKRSSRRLRRTSIEIYRRSLHDAEDVGSEDDNTNLLTVDTESDLVAADIQMHTTSDDAFCNELALSATESDHPLMTPTVDLERLDVLSDVTAIKIPSMENSKSVQPKTGILFEFDTLYFHS